MITLRIERLEFYSHKDEANLFSWLESLSVVSEVSGEVRTIIVSCQRSTSDEDLRELIAMFARYQVEDMKQLAQFLTEDNTSWFLNSKKYWYDQVFGNLL